VSCGLTVRFTGVKPAIAALLVERPVQAVVRRQRPYEPTDRPG